MNFQTCQTPSPLKPGDLLKVIAPSGCLREFEAFNKGVEIWRSRGYRVELSPGYDDRWGYLAGKDDDRRQQLADAWKDSECRGILCARGGYGGARLLENWNWSTFNVGAGLADNLSEKQINFQPNPPFLADNLSGKQINFQPNPPLLTPKWLIGFSDITSLLWSLSAVGISGVHGPLLTTLAAEPDWSKQRLFDWVEGRHLEHLQGNGWGGGIAKGQLLPANLTVATHLLNTVAQPPLEGVILAFEDVTEAPYRIDRMLTQWRMMGLFKGVRGIALGRFSQCEPPKNVPSFSVEEVLRDRLGDLGIPVVSDLPFGHDGENAALPVGIMVELDGDKGTLSFTRSQVILNE